jgi:hypothetical protein
MKTRTSLITALGACLALAAPASAEVRHASPLALGTACTAASPCTLERALDYASEGDEIVVHGGTHTVEQAGSIDPGSKTHLRIRPAAGAGRPEIQTTVAGCALQVGDGTDVEGLRLRLTSDSAQGLCTTGEVNVKRMAITGPAANVTGISMMSPDLSTVHDTSIYLPGSAARGILASEATQVDVENVTIDAGRSALQLQAGPQGAVANIRASYLHGDDQDVHALCNVNPATVHLVENAYDTTKVDGSFCTIDVGAGNTGTAGADLEFEDGILRPGPSSTLLDRAPATFSTDETDVDGDPRLMGGALDVGADERRVPPQVLTQGATAVTTQSAKLSSFVNRRGSDATAVFEYGTTQAYGQTVTAAGGGQQGGVLVLTPFSADVAGLAPQTTYHFRIRVTNQFGQVAVGEDRTFTTPAAPVATTGDGGGGSGDKPSGETPPPPVVPEQDRTAPACSVKLRPAKRPGRATLSGRCSEDSLLRVAVRGKHVVELRVKRGSFSRVVKTGVLRPGRKAVRVVARDLSGNVAQAAKLALPAKKRS